MSSSDKDNSVESPALVTRSLRSRDKSQFSCFVKALEDPEKVPDYAVTKRNSEKRKVGEPLITTKTTPKRRITFGPDQVEECQDVYCWDCHKLCIEGCLDCSACPRTFHPKCISASDALCGVPEQWTCPVCNQIMKSECADTRSWAMQLLSVERFSCLLSFALQRMRHPDSEPFRQPVPKSELADYYDVVFHPMDLNTLEKNTRKRYYASTEAFLEDAKWILHNCIIYNGPSSKFVADAKLIIRICKHEMNEIEICPDCYLNSSRKDSRNWFTEPCTYPHCLVWAKLKGFPYWPAKALRISGSNNVDVRFFGAHDRSWIPIANCCLLSEEAPVPIKSSKKYGLEQAMAELQDHLQRIREKFGFFQYAPQKSEFLPGHLYACDVLFGSDIKLPSPANGKSRRPHSGFEEVGDVDGSVDLTLQSSDCFGSPRRPDSSCSGNSATFTKGKTGVAVHQPSTSDGTVGKIGQLNSAKTFSEPAPHLAGEAAADMAVDDNTAGVFTLTTEAQMSDLADDALPDHHDHELSRAFLARVQDTSEVVNNLAARLLPTPSAAPDTNDTRRSMEKNSRNVSGDAEEPSAVKKLGHLKPSPSPTQVIKDNTSEICSITVADKLSKKRSLTSCLQKLAKSKKTAPLSLIEHPRGVDLSPSASGVGATTPGHVSSSSTPPIAPFENSAPSVQHRGDVIKTCVAKVSAALSTALEELFEQLQDASRASPPAIVSNTVQEQKALRTEMSRMVWLQKQAVAELEYNTKLVYSELQEQFMVERQRLLDEQKRKLEDEKQRSIAETKLKQWCANCGKEAMFYCCWNTSYCDYPCQQQHWLKHQEVCAQMRQSNGCQDISQSVAQSSFVNHGISQTNPAQVQYVPGMVSLFAQGPHVPQSSSVRPAQTHSVNVTTHYPAMQPRPTNGVRRRQ